MTEILDQGEYNLTDAERTTIEQGERLVKRSRIGLFVYAAIYLGLGLFMFLSMPNSLMVLSISAVTGLVYLFNAFGSKSNPVVFFVLALVWTFFVLLANASVLGFNSRFAISFLLHVLLAIILILGIMHANKLKEIKSKVGDL